MSNITSFYLGPFVVCENGIEPRKVSMVTCPSLPGECDWRKVSASHVPSVLFCPRCGQKFRETVIVQDESRVNIGDVADELDDSLCLAHQEYNRDRNDRWIPNDLDSLTVGWFDRDSCLRIDLRSLDISAEIEWFLVEFKHELEILRRLYGADAVSVQWGLVSSWS